MRFAKEELKGYPVSKVCKVLGVSKSSYYKQGKRTEKEEKEEEEAVIQSFQKNHGRYGRIRIRKELQRKGIEVSEYRISNILQRNGLKAKSGRRGTRRKEKKEVSQYLEENLIREKFTVNQPNYLWCSDITELKCHGTKIYLCGIIDVATRRIVGWSIAKNQTQKLVQDAFRMAVGRNPERPKDAIYHSDRGCQYTAKKTKELVESHGFRKSMSRPGKPNDNQLRASGERSNVSCQTSGTYDMQKQRGRLWTILNCTTIRTASIQVFSTWHQTNFSVFDVSTNLYRFHE